METTVRKSEINKEAIIATIEKIKQLAQDNNYQIKGDIDKILNRTKEENFDLEFFVGHDLSTRKVKKLNDLIARYNKHPKMSTANKFLHFLMTKIYKSEDRVRILPSEKELAIQEKRKAYKAALETVKKAYADYKTEKGDFYKK